MNRKQFIPSILRILRDFLILIAIGNFLALFTMEWEHWTLRIILQNCLFSIGIGFPAWRGMTYLSQVLENRLPWLKYPIKRLIYQVLVLFVFSGVIIFLGLAVWLMLSENLDFASAVAVVMPSMKVAYIFMFLALLLGNSVHEHFCTS